MSKTHVPIRTCIGCRTRAARSELVRHVLEHDAATGSRRVVRDERATKPGRGAWLHDNDACREQALRKRAFRRALRMRDGDGHVTSP